MRCVKTCSIVDISDPQLNMYNFGWIGNLKHYGQLNPPAYNLTKVTLPAVYIFHGNNDYIVTAKVYKTITIIDDVENYF